MKLKLKTRTPIGLDIGTRWFSAVQLCGAGVGGGAQWNVEAAVRVPRAASGGTPTAGATREEFSRLWEVLDRRGFTGRKVVLAAPESALVTATLELPPRGSGAPVEELARQELARSVKREPSEMEVACWDVPRPGRGAGGGDGTTHVLAVGLAHAESEPLLDAAEDSGAVVEALECRCCAMARACERMVQAGAGGGVTAIVDVSDVAVSIAVMHSGVVVYDRVVRDAGLEGLRGMVRGGLGSAGLEEDALELAMEAITGQEILPEHTAGTVQGLVDEYVAQVVQELRNVMAYSIHRYPGSIGPVLLAGPGAGVPQLSARIEKELDLQTRVVTLRDVGSGDGVGAAGVGVDAAMTVAAGLAMRPRRVAAGVVGVGGVVGAVARRAA